MGECSSATPVQLPTTTNYNGETNITTSMAAAADGKISVLMVCLGNICRSPMAEAVFRQVAVENNLLDRFDKIDSAGTAAYHAGEPPDPRSAAVCAAHNVPVQHLARRVTKDDFRTFDYILAMDEYNLRDLQEMRPADATAVKLGMFGDYEDGERRGVVVEDPYYGGKRGFEVNFGQCLRFSRNFMREVLGADIE
ncbi:hypothetical protein TWF696_003614 [Orbilia brochopaga]|uniref:Phosphotyrosine protein phosphatase I domain-containing protein n=1 Tax=Orbilia brochopaga TaxID=3140254 RepID=A0AAV9TYP7_9PEZI